MNVFEFLGLPKGHRSSSKVVQKVQAFKDANKKKISRYQMGQRKFDGVYLNMVVQGTGEFSLFNRTGKLFTNLDDLKEALSINLPITDRCFFGELCCDCCSLEELSGMVNPNRTKPLSEKQQEWIKYVYIAWFDSITVSEFIIGYSDTPAQIRYNDLKCLMLTFPKSFVIGSRMCAFGATVSVPLDAAIFAKLKIDRGYEGAVFKDPAGDWLAGRKNYTQTKIVRGCDYDLRIVDTQVGDPGTKRYEQVTNLIVEWRLFGKPDGELVRIPVDCGKGWTDELRQGAFEFPERYVGMIVHVHALQIGSQGLLRLPKAEEIRIDKEEADL
jgi:hypothetical protein